MNLEQAVSEELIRIANFKKWWLLMNKKNPEHFPLEMEAGNEGLWFENMMEFEDSHLTDLIASEK